MDDGILVLSFEGTQTIEKSEKIKNDLLNAIKGKKKEIYINLSKVEKIDLSFLQLLYSANLEAISKKKKLSITGEVSLNFKNMLKLSGFSRKTNLKGNYIFSEFIEDGE